jgi:KDO2-lipid IV(A) lauroyltransferase
MLEHIILYRIGQALALRLPLKLGYLLAILISDIRYIFAKTDRRNVTANLKCIFPEKNKKEISQIRKELFRNFAKYLVEFFCFSKIDLEYVKKNIHLENVQYLREALSEQKGAICLSAHMGNWELGGVIVALTGYPISAVVLPHKDKRVDHFFNSQRIRKGLNIIPLGKAARQCLNNLKANKVIALMGDRNFTERGIVLDFFGRKAYFPDGPAVFSIRTGAPIVPCFVIRNKNERFTMIFERPIKLVPCGNLEKDVKELVSRYKIIIENYIRRYPQQWYMFRRFWLE